MRPTNPKEKVSAIMAQEDFDLDESTHTTTLQVIGALNVEQPKWGGLRLMFVPMTLNGREVSTFVDTRTTFSFIYTKVSDQL